MVVKSGQVLVEFVVKLDYSQVVEYFAQDPFNSKLVIHFVPAFL